MSATFLNNKASYLTILTVFVAFAIIAVFAVPTPVYGVSVGDAQSPEKYVEDYTQHNCLDISSWNGDITESEWEAIKDAGVDSVIIRAGYSTLNTGRIKKDEKFEVNIERATDAGLDVGVYYFTVALTPYEAEREAKSFVKIISPYSSKITLPAVLDYETNSGGRLNAHTVRELGPDNCTKICCTFLDIVAEAGFEPMLYASRGLLNGALDAEKLEQRYLIWLAQYTNDLSATGYEGDFYMWQYSSSVRIPNVNCRFDANYLYEKKFSALEEYKNIIAKKDGDETVTFNLSADVKSRVPVTSTGDTAKVFVKDSEGTNHKYTIYKTGYSIPSGKKNLSDDECILSCLMSGYSVSTDETKNVLSKDSGSYSMGEIADILSDINVPYEFHKGEKDIYVKIKSYLANGMPVLLSVKSDSSKWGRDSHKMLLVGMDEDGRAIVADTTDREWSGDDQRVKLASVISLADSMDNGYFLIGKTIR